MGVLSEIQKLSPSALIELFELDAVALGGDVRYFHAGTNELGGDVVWQGNTYTRLPIEATGFEMRGSGTLPRPLIRLSNMQGLIAAEARESGGFLGAKVTRRRTFARFLDAVNFAAGNPEADPTQALPDEIWYVDRKSNEDQTMIEFELASALDMVGMLLPRRQIIQNTCTWLYRDGNCNYTGGPVADVNNMPTSDPSKDRCAKTLTACKLRFGDGRIPIGSFPGVGLVR
jgi:lambda family phage minor tail protein L